MRKKSIFTIVIAVSIGVLGACGQKEIPADKEVSEDGVKKIIVGTGNGYKPYCYLDEEGNLAGYEYEVLKAVDELLPQYEFEFETSEFTALFTSLDAGKIDIAAHQIEHNEERGEKYLFGQEPYTTFVTYITVLKEEKTISSIDDLAGKTVYLPTGDNSEYILGKYNEEHPDNPIILDIQAALSSDELMAGMRSGKWDACIKTKRDVEDFNKEYEDILKISGNPIQTSDTYFVFKKENEELQIEIDEAVKQLKDSGKLRQISIDVIGGDYTESE